MKYSKSVTDRLEFLDRNYEQIVSYHLSDNKKIALGDKSSRKCRFCDKGEKETSFKNEAHAIPEFIGNKTLVALYECDICNAKFSKLLESQMANCFNLWHTVSQVKGKKGVPSFKTNQKKSRIDVKELNVEIINNESDQLANYDNNKKTLTLKAKKATYIPIAVYKCLVKMALTIMPSDELKNFRTTIAWINENEHINSPQNLKSLFILRTLVYGVNPFPFVSCMLLRRKSDALDNVPFMLFIVTYGNFAFQIHLPLCIEDIKLINSEVKMIYIPTYIDIDENFKEITRENLNFNSKQPIKGEIETIQMRFKSIKPLYI